MLYESCCRGSFPTTEQTTLGKFLILNRPIDNSGLESK